MAIGGAAVLLVAAVASIGTPAAQAAGVPVPCANSVSGVNVTEGDTVDLGIASGCTLVSSSAAGNLEPLSSTSFLAFAAGSGSINAGASQEGASQPRLRRPRRHPPPSNRHRNRPPPRVHRILRPRPRHHRQLQRSLRRRTRPQARPQARPRRTTFPTYGRRSCSQPLRILIKV